MMIKISYPDVKPKVRKKNQVNEVFCASRKRWIKLTKEEWVRQNFLLYLIHICNIPASLIAVERKVVVGTLTKRFDIVVFKNDQPYMLIECKEMGTNMDLAVMMQALRYNSVLQAPFMAMTNGVYTYLFALEGGEMVPCTSFPVWE
jgi:hypothetical protein